MILIVGSGLAGSLFAIRLNQLGIAAKLFDKNDIFKESHADGRTIAITYDSKIFLEECNIWEEIKDSAEPINHIRVFEHGSAWTVDYNSVDLSNNPMGYIIEYDCLKKVFIKHLKESNFVEMCSLCNITRLEQKDENVILHTQDNKIAGSLLIAADGRNSWVRSNVDIKSKTVEYGHKALVVHFKHEKPHQNTAWEIFHQNGPFAALPMNSTDDGNNQSGIVWCSRKNKEWEYLENSELEMQLEEIFPYYGKVKINSKRWIFPITGMTVDKIIDKRVVLIGDAAHALHPVAGQGINLGWRDVRILAKEIAEAHSLGLDYGSQTFLRKYSSKRKFDSKGLFLFTNFMAKLFEIDNPLVSFVRQAGFAVVNNVKPLKKFLMKKAISGYK